MSSRSSTTASRRRRHHAATGGNQRGHPSLRRSLLVTTTASGENARIPEDFQGFSVESADFAHGYLTKERMSERLQTLGDHGIPTRTRLRR